MDAQELADALVKVRSSDAPALTRIDRYLSGKHDSVYVPDAAMYEFRWLVERSVVNVVPLVVDTIAQSLYVEGYRSSGASDNAEGWADWQANRMDAYQTGIHRAALAYGSSYLYVAPGDEVPVWRPKSPRYCTALYNDPVADEWPVAALLVSESDDTQAIMLDESYAYDLVLSDSGAEIVGAAPHRAGVTPVVRFLNRFDLDGKVVGEIAPLTALQDQLNFTTFSLLMAQQYAAFRQRWVTGMAIPEDAAGNPVEPFEAAVNRLWVGEDPDTKFGEFSQTELRGYLDSREATLQILATVSQVPPHHLIGKIANLSAEALAAAEVQQSRKVAERRSLFGESWEQAFRLSAAMRGDEAGATDTTAQVVWRDTEARSLSQTVDALGKLTQMLGVPPQALWERVPGVTQSDIERWEGLAQTSDPLAGIAATLAAQSNAAAEADLGDAG